MKDKTLKILKTAGVAAFWVAIWQVAAIAVGSKFLFASPLDTVTKLVQMAATQDFWLSVLTSVANILCGFIAGVVFGVLAASVSSVSNVFKTLFSPLTVVIKSVPVASFIILALVWIKADSLAVLISFLMVFPVIYTNTLGGIMSADPMLKETARVFRMRRVYRVAYIYFPAAMPQFVSGCSIALGLCWKAGVAAEVIGQAGNSIGEHLYLAKLYLDTAELFAYTLVIVIISLIFEKTFVRLLNLLKGAVLRGNKKSL